MVNSCGERRTMVNLLLTITPKYICANSSFVLYVKDHLVFWLDNIKGNYYEINTISFNLPCLKKKKEWIEILRVLLAWGDSSMKKKNLRELEP